MASRKKIRQRPRQSSLLGATGQRQLPQRKSICFLPWTVKAGKRSGWGKLTSVDAPASVL
jgi:hypothetical protein